MNKEKPILFSTPMIIAIQEGKKTMTRRIIPKKIVDAYYEYDDWVNSVGKPDCAWSRLYEKEVFIEKSRYSVGTILWVKEAIREKPNEPPMKSYCTYEADCTPVVVRWHGERALWGWQRKKLPGMFMPKDFARIFLEVTDVKVERLKDISDGDVAREGVLWNEPFQFGRDERDCNSPAQRAFRRLWDSINGEESWQENPWVWVYTFKPQVISDQLVK